MKASERRVGEWMNLSLLPVVVSPNQKLPLGYLEGQKNEVRLWCHA